MSGADGASATSTTTAQAASSRHSPRGSEDLAAERTETRSALPLRALGRDAGVQALDEAVAAAPPLIRCQGGSTSSQVPGARVGYFLAAFFLRWAQYVGDPQEVIISRHSSTDPVDDDAVAGSSSWLGSVWRRRLRCCWVSSASRRR